MIAGGDTLHALNAMLTCRLAREQPADAQLITLTLGGSTLPTTGLDAQRMCWLDEHVLHEGDMLTITLRDDVLPYVPPLHMPPASREESERFMFENCKRAYFALRDEYEMPQS